MSSSATATQLREVEIYPNGDVHVSIEPNSTQGAVLDAHGDVATVPEKGLMVRLDAKAKENITLSKGTVAAIGLIPVILMLVLNYGAAAFGWVRDDQSKTLQIQQLQNDVNSMKEDVKTIKETMQKQQVDDAKATGYKLGVTETQADHGKRVN